MLLNAKGEPRSTGGGAKAATAAPCGGPAVIHPATAPAAVVSKYHKYNDCLIMCIIAYFFNGRYCSAYVGCVVIKHLNKHAFESRYYLP